MTTRGLWAFLVAVAMSVGGIGTSSAAPTEDRIGHGQLAGTNGMGVVQRMALIDFDEPTGSGNTQFGTLDSKGYRVRSEHAHVVFDPEACSFDGCVSDATPYIAQEDGGMGRPVVMTRADDGKFAPRFQGLISATFYGNDRINSGAMSFDNISVATGRTRQATLNTHQDWDGDANRAPFGCWNSNTTMGQVITIPNGMTRLTRFNFYLRNWEEAGSMVLRGEVYQWDGTRATGVPFGSPSSDSSTTETMRFTAYSPGRTASTTYSRVLDTSSSQASPKTTSSAPSNTPCPLRRRRAAAIRTENRSGSRTPAMNRNGRARIGISSTRTPRSRLG